MQLVDLSALFESIDEEILLFLQISFQEAEEDFPKMQYETWQRLGL